MIPKKVSKITKKSSVTKKRILFKYNEIVSLSSDEFKRKLEQRLGSIK